MAYDEYLEERIKDVLESRSIAYEDKKMFGGLCFLVDDKMCIGIIRDQLMARVGPDNEKELLGKPGAKPMDFTNRPMKGYLYVEPAAIDRDEELEFWVEQCLAYNPQAKSSKRKKKK